MCVSGISRGTGKTKLERRERRVRRGMPTRRGSPRLSFFRSRRGRIHQTEEKSFQTSVLSLRAALLWPNKVRVALSFLRSLSRSLSYVTTILATASLGYPVLSLPRRFLTTRACLRTAISPDKFRFRRFCILSIATFDRLLSNQLVERSDNY